MQEKNGEKMTNFRHDYTQSMMMKIKMADPSPKGGSEVYFDCEQTLEKIKAVDNLTLGIKKIVYLVGWQYNGHDDKYPSFFEVNPKIKRSIDKTALQSLLWLIKEGEKYNTIVSVHINFADAYENSPLFEEYAKQGAIIRNGFGGLAKIERYNGKACYKISYKEEWESGLFKSRIDKILDLLPLAKLGTVHVDNFQCYVNRKPYVSAKEMQDYRKKMIAYLAEKGIDITSEFTYREGKLTKLMYGRIVRDVISKHYPIDLLNIIPAVWWTDKMTFEEYYKYYPHTYGGGLPKNKKIFNIFYGNIHGEESFNLKNGWVADFIKEFLTINVPFYYLNSKKRLKMNDDKIKSVEFEGNIISDESGTITQNGKIIKQNNDLFLPYKDGFVAYSENGKTIDGKIDGCNTAEIYKFTIEGLAKVKVAKLENHTIKLTVASGEGLFIKKID